MGLHCLQITLLGVSGLQWVKQPVQNASKYATDTVSINLKKGYHDY